MKSQTNPVRTASVTQDSGKVRLGDMAPVFEKATDPDVKKIKCDTATQDKGKVRLGDMAPRF